MKISVNFDMFCEAFRMHNREDQFSMDAKIALFNKIEEMEQDSGQEFELDVIALCCEYVEYDDMKQMAKDFLYDEDQDELAKLSYVELVERLSEYTEVLVHDSGIVFASF